MTYNDFIIINAALASWAGFLRECLTDPDEDHEAIRAELKYLPELLKKVEDEVR